eukprot:3941185-Rhodomonas_salina.3
MSKADTSLLSSLPFPISLPLCPRLLLSSSPCSLWLSVHPPFLPLLLPSLTALGSSDIDCKAGVFGDPWPYQVRTGRGEEGRARTHTLTYTQH